MPDSSQTTPSPGQPQALQWAEDPPDPRAAWTWRLARLAATLAVAGIGILAALVIWSYYVTAPWTRDGRVRVQVANVASQVSGQITEVRVVDNQYVHKGDVLYVVDPFDYRVKLAAAVSATKQAAADYAVKRAVAERLLKLSDLATSAQSQQQAAGASDAAEASFASAQQQQHQAQLNLARTQIRSPVTGFVTNMLMRVGDYAMTGSTNISVIDTASYWIDGYFEETKLSRICIGDRAEARLMGFQTPIVGTVDTVTRGISVANATPSTQGLPEVNAVYTWVRLAQRVPVRIRITDVPPGVPLVAGLTATVTLTGQGQATRPGMLASAATSIRDVFAAPPPRPDCIPATAGGTGLAATLPEPQTGPPLTPSQVVPGLAPGLTTTPTRP